MDNFTFWPTLFLIASCIVWVLTTQLISLQMKSVKNLALRTLAQFFTILGISTVLWYLGLLGKLVYDNRPADYSHLYVLQYLSLYVAISSRAPALLSLFWLALAVSGYYYGLYQDQVDQYVNWTVAAVQGSLDQYPWLKESVIVLPRLLLLALGLAPIEEFNRRDSRRPHFVHYVLRIFLSMAIMASALFTLVDARILLYNDKFIVPLVVTAVCIYIPLRDACVRWPQTAQLANVVIAILAAVTSSIYGSFRGTIGILALAGLTLIMSANLRSSL